jgi:hypothetical protein
VDDRARRFYFPFFRVLPKSAGIRLGSSGATFGTVLLRGLAEVIDELIVLGDGLAALLSGAATGGAVLLVASGMTIGFGATSGSDCAAGLRAASNCASARSQNSKSRPEGLPALSHNWEAKAAISLFCIPVFRSIRVVILFSNQGSRGRPLANVVRLGSRVTSRGLPPTAEAVWRTHFRDHNKSVASVPSKAGLSVRRTNTAHNQPAVIGKQVLCRTEGRMI